MDESTKVIDFPFFYLWWTDITAAGLLGFLSAVPLKAAAAECDADLSLTRISLKLPILTHFSS